MWRHADRPSHPRRGATHGVTPTYREQQTLVHVFDGAVTEYWDEDDAATGNDEYPERGCHQPRANQSRHEVFAEHYPQCRAENRAANQLRDSEKSRILIIWSTASEEHFTVQL